MESITGEITLHDLLAWEPGLELVSPYHPSPGSPDPLTREVDWVLTARSTAPMLPFLRGGELIVLPHRVVEETGVSFMRLVSEITMQPVAGVLTEEPPAEVSSSPLVILRTRVIGPDFESNLNRLITSRRRELLESAAEVDRIIADVRAAGARAAILLETLEARLHLPLSVRTGTGAILFSAGQDASRVPSADDAPRTWLSAPLKNERWILIGPISPERHAVGRIVLNRIRDGIQRSLDNDAVAAPHGNQRTIALNALLIPAPGMTRDQLAEQAFRAGIAPGRQLRVVLTPVSASGNEARRLASPLGDVLDAGTVHGFNAMITIATPSTSKHPHLMTSRELPWAAVSEVVSTARDLPEAARQAHYIAQLLAQGSLSGSVVHFTDNSALGAYRLVYDHWGSSTLERYTASLLGDLLREDRRGMLVSTLRIFLENGGSHRPTAERLGIHRNTLSYRLRQIRSIVNGDLDDPHVQLSLQIALLASELPSKPE